MVNFVGRTVAIIDEDVVSGFRYFSDLFLSTVHLPNIFDLEGKGMNFRYHAINVGVSIL